MSDLRAADRDLTGAAPAEVAAKIMPHYRADIDGLRALAVVAVIFTHARIAGFPGGFVGVDIFFVISGYLIYRDLTTRAREGRLSLLGFYGRRARRTLPALYLVAFVTFAAGAFVLLPSEFEEAGRSLVAAVLLVPNIFFMSKAGYFEALAGSRPLLHTWSLGIEEQFYLLAPFLVLALSRLASGPRRVLLAALAVLSLIFAIVLRQTAPAAAFYLMPSRAFEFLLGAAVVEGLIPSFRRRWLAEAVAAAALVTLLASIVLFGNATPHPGLATLGPCVATAIIIHVGATWRTLTGALLGLRAFAFVGLISYSLYLWHWPILVLSYAARFPRGPALLIAQALLLVGLSVASWRFVEMPFRDPASVWRRRAPVLLPSGAAILLGIGVLVAALDGMPQRFPPDVATVASSYAFRNTKPFREGQCFITSKSGADTYDRETCLKIVPGAANVLLIGDSQAAHLWSALRDTWPGINVLQATASGCKPLLGSTGSARCTDLMREMLERFVPQHHLDAVVIGGQWNRDDVAPLQRTLEALAPHVGKIIVFGPMPRYDDPLPTLLARAMLRQNFDEVVRFRVKGTIDLDARMRASVAPLATYVSPYKLLCRRNGCRLFAAPTVPMLFDYSHLTPQGAMVLMASVKSQNPSLFPPR